MNVTAHYFIVTPRVVAAIASGTVASNLTASTQQSQVLAQGSNSNSVAAVKLDGSSTVYPITKAVAEEFRNHQEAKQAEVTVNFSGTNAGLEKFCAGQTDISNASHPILSAEMAACNKNIVRFIELPVAFDALTVVVNPQNNWAEEIAVAELKKIWEPAAEGKITRWKQVRTSWPDRPLKLCRRLPPR